MLREADLRLLEAHLPLQVSHLQRLEADVTDRDFHLSRRDLHLAELDFRLPLRDFHLLELDFHLPDCQNRHPDREARLFCPQTRLRTPKHMRPLLWDSDEIDPFTGQKYTWDSTNPNITWDGILEPGDLGYTPPPPLSVSPTQRKSTMKHNSYFPTNVPEQILWLTNFFVKLIVHGTALGLSAPQIAAAVADCRWLIYLLGSFRPAERAWAKANTDYLRDAKFGEGDTVLVLPDFDPPTLPVADPAPGGLPAVVPQKPGALSRIFALVDDLKKVASEAIATDLGIIGTEMAPPPPPESFQPVIQVKRVGAHIVIEWGWGGLRDHVEMLQIQVDRGAGWTDLAFDSTPDYNDTHPHPATLTTWKYRAIWRADDAQIGIWSAEVSVVVGG